MLSGEVGTTGNLQPYYNSLKGNNPSQLYKEEPTPSKRDKKTYIEITEVVNGFIITATNNTTNETLIRICTKDNDLMEELAKMLVSLKLANTERVI